MVKGIVAVVIGSALLVSCSSSSDGSTPPSSDAPLTTEAPSATTSSPSESSSTAPTTALATAAPTTSGPPGLTIRCDADSDESPTFEVPLGTSVTLVATSSIEREFHLHDYDIELTGVEVTFQFTADIPGTHELTEHPDHTTVCTIVS